MTSALRCHHCGRTVTHKSAIHTRAGVRCKHCADQLPPHLRRPQTAAESESNMTEAELYECIRDTCRWQHLLCYHTRDSRGSYAGFPDLVT
jgi:hypothetical protein